MIERNVIQNGPGFAATTENLTSIKLYAQVYPTEKLSINAAVIWAKWTDPVGSGIRAASEMPAYRHPANYYSIYRAPFFAPWSSAVVSADLGWEVDLGFTYQIMEGLTYTFAAGVLFTGDSWDYINPANGTRYDWGPIWSIQNTLRYTF